MRRFAALTLILLWAPLAGYAKENQYEHPVRVQVDREGERWAERTLKRMSLEEKVGQMLQIRGLAGFTNFESDDYKQFRDTIRRYHIGSVILTVPVDGPLLLRTLPYEVAALTNQLQRDSKYPLLFTADFERGISMRVAATPPFPHAMAFGAAGSLEFARRFGEISARNARAIGIQWNYFPVADVNSNPDNPIINTRSFGEDPKQVGDLLAAYIEGARQNGMLTTAKHFPGHGDTGPDSHLELARVGGNLERLDSVELPPFKRAIAAGVDAVMVAHVTVPALEPDPDKVATTSPNIVTKLLQQQMGFKGIVVTDAMEMEALKRLYAPGPSASGRAAVDAIKAGNDLVLLPTDLDSAYRGILDAVHNREITEQRIDISVRKLLLAKAAVGLNRSRLVDLDEIGTRVATPADMELAQQVADSAITLVRNHGPELPLPKGSRVVTVPGSGGPPSLAQSGSDLIVVVLTDDIRGEMGRELTRSIAARAPGTRSFYVDERTAGTMAEAVLDAARQASTVIVAAYVIPTAAKLVTVQGQVTNSVDLPDSMGGLLNRILEIAAPKTALVAMGSPYLALSFPQVQTYLCAYSSAPSSELAAAKAIFGEIPIRGKLPVSLKNIAERGDGIQVPETSASKKP